LLNFDFQRTPAEWNFETVPQAHCDNRTLYQPRGKMLGGCSSINAQCYQHCSPSDYDQWEKLGAKGWAWKDLKPYFAKSENYTPNPLHQIDESKRGKGGEWQTSYPPTNEITSAFLEAGVSHFFL
jgi:choline dehydrogenase